MMSDQWQLKPLGELCTVVNGGTPKSKVTEYWKGEVNWITPAEMGKMSSPYIDITKRKITELGLQKSSAKLFPPYSVILSTRAPIGHLAINTSPMSTNQGCKTLVPNDELDYKYLYYFLYSNKELLDNLGTGATFNELSGKNLKGVEIPVPSLEEQQRIVSILDEAFEHISNSVYNFNHSAKLVDEFFEAELQTVFRNNSLDWDKIEFEEAVVKVKATPKIKKQDFKETGPYPIISQEINYINGYWDKTSDLLTIQHPVVVFGDHTKTLKYIDFDFVRGADGLKVLQPREFILPKFFYHQLRSVKLESLGYARHYRLLKRIEIRYPDMKQQQQIASTFDELDEQALQMKKLFEHELQSLDELKQSLLHEAFSGKLTGGTSV
jgi:type I restriction enzyme, S subunit